MIDAQSSAWVISLALLRQLICWELFVDLMFPIVTGGMMLSVAAKTDKRDVTLKLKDFLIPPEDVRRMVKHWNQWIGYWAVD